MNILINVSNPEDYLFYRRMYSFFKYKKWNVSYLANNIIIFTYLLAYREKCFLVKKTSFSNGKYSAKNSFSTLTSRLTQEEAKIVYNSFYSFMYKNQEKYHWDLIVIPSGRLINQIAIKDYCEEHNIKTLFVGYGNIIGKTFVDPQGTDKQSYLFSCPFVLDQYKENLNEYEKWENDYVENKRVKHVIGQARNVDFKLKLKKTVQITSCYIERFLKIASENSYYYRDMGRINNKKLSANSSLPEEFIFFPMQVSTDAQIILNYDKESVLDGLKEAVYYAKDKELALVIKEHPAEINTEILTKIEEMQVKYNFYISNKNTFELIFKSSEVVTINSTVGLESLMSGKQVTFLGDTFYKNLSDKQRRANYINKYLVNIEYFSSEKIPYEICEQFFERANVHLTNYEKSI